MRLVLALLSVAVIGGVYGLGMVTAHYKWPPYQQSINWLLAAMAAPNHASTDSGKAIFYDGSEARADVVMFGDSTTFFAEWHELFPNIKIINRGLPGDTTFGLRNRLDTVISTDPEKVFILVGINDIATGRPIDESLSDYESVINALKSEGIEVFVQSVLSCTYSRCTDERVSAVTEYNAKLESLAGERGATYIDINGTLSPGGEFSPAYTIDGTHPNYDGYLAWAETIRPLMN